MRNLQAQRPVATPTTGQSAVLKDRELKRVASFIGSEVGIQLPESKRTLVEGRLRKRLRALGFSDFGTYLDYVLESDEGELEKLQLIDVITTNKTHFYREPEHFDYLIKKAIPELDHNRKTDSRRQLNIWSAGCSTGEEAYTLCIELSEAAERYNFIFKILATDISHSCLSKASRGVYTERQAESIPLEFRKKYLLRSRNTHEALVQMGPELRQKIQFKSLNLMDKLFNVPDRMDAIFCRNVMIYFNNQLREELIGRFESQLVAGGYLFVGHSESLNGIKTSLKQVAPMVYRKV